MNNDMTGVTPYEPGVPHPKSRCTRCVYIDKKGLTRKELIEAVISDAEHWGVDWVEQQLANYGVNAMFRAHRVLVGTALRGDLPNVASVAGLYIHMAKRFKEQEDGLD